MAWTNATGAGFTMPGPLGYQQINSKPAHPKVRGRTLADLSIPGPLGQTSVASTKRVTAGQGATVWASHNMVDVDWKNTPTSGWSHLFKHVRGLGDICEAMKGAGLQDGVSQLGIIAHGNDAGQVLLDRPLRPETVESFSGEFHELAKYLRTDGILTFYSCIAGFGKMGSALLAAISSLLPERTIVGFEVSGVVSKGDGERPPPGRVWGTTDDPTLFSPVPNKAIGMLNPWNPFAKRARNGRIVHITIGEQNERPNKTCANPACPGHGKPGDLCPGW